MSNTVFLYNKICCIIIHKYPILSTRYSVMCKVYIGYHGASEIEHGLCACTVDNPRAFRTGAQTMLYLSLNLLNRERERERVREKKSYPARTCCKHSRLLPNPSCSYIKYLPTYILCNPIYALPYVERSGQV